MSDLEGSTCPPSQGAFPGLLGQRPGRPDASQLESGSAFFSEVIQWLGVIAGW